MCRGVRFCGGNRATARQGVIDSSVVYHEDGSVRCYDRVSAPMIKHKMAYIGHEPDRGTLKYRCPAKHEGWE